MSPVGRGDVAVGEVMARKRAVLALRAVAAALPRCMILTLHPPKAHNLDEVDTTRLRRSRRIFLAARGSSYLTSFERSASPYDSSGSCQSCRQMNPSTKSTQPGEAAQPAESAQPREATQPAESALPREATQPAQRAHNPPPAHNRLQRKPMPNTKWQK